MAKEIELDNIKSSKDYELICIKAVITKTESGEIFHIGNDSLDIPVYKVSISQEDVRKAIEVYGKWNKHLECIEEASIRIVGSSEENNGSDVTE